MGQKLGGPTMKQPTFYWGAMEKYTELKNFRLEVNNIFKMYNINNTEKISTINYLIDKAYNL